MLPPSDNRTLSNLPDHYDIQVLPQDPCDPGPVDAYQACMGAARHLKVDNVDPSETKDTAGQQHFRQRNSLGRLRFKSWVCGSRSAIIDEGRCRFKVMAVGFVLQSWRRRRLSHEPAYPELSLA